MCTSVVVFNTREMTRFSALPDRSAVIKMLIKKKIILHSDFWAKKDESQMIIMIVLQLFVSRPGNENLLVGRIVT